LIPTDSRTRELAADPYYEVVSSRSAPAGAGIRNAAFALSDSGDGAAGGSSVKERHSDLDR